MQQTDFNSTDKFIGLQIKPVSDAAYIPEIYKERYIIQKSTHEKFTKKYGGKVFYIFSVKKDKKKIIANPEIIKEIENEIEYLKK